MVRLATNGEVVLEDLPSFAQAVGLCDLDPKPVTISLSATLGVGVAVIFPRKRPVESRSPFL